MTLSLAALSICAACGSDPRPEALDGAGRSRELLPEWSPENADLLFVSTHDGDSEITLLEAGGSGWINLSRNPATDNWPEWSPDGTRIAFQSDRTGNLDIWVMNADGTDPVQLTDDPEHDYLPAWSPDGKRISFTSWRREQGDAERTNHIYIMNADGSGETRLFDESPGTSAGVSWSPDGQLLALDRKPGDRGADVAILDLKGAIVRRLTDDEAYNGSPVFSPDGSRIAFYSDWGSTSELVIVGLDGSGRTTPVRDGLNWYPRWSPDGRWLVYTAANPSGGEDDLDVMAVPLEGSRIPVILAGGPGRQTEGRWRPVPGASTGP